jgi:hypothetical protein
VGSYLEVDYEMCFYGISSVFSYLGAMSLFLMPTNKIYVEHMGESTCGMGDEMAVGRTTG